MFGTGESPSSSRESMTPSTISSSSTVGTYCCHMGSPTSLMEFNACGVKRIWKLSNAGLRASTSITSCPNLSASFSRVAMLSSLRILCQSLIQSPLLDGAAIRNVRAKRATKRTTASNLFQKVGALAAKAQPHSLTALREQAHTAVVQAPDNPFRQHQPCARVQHPGRYRDSDSP